MAVVIFGKNKKIQNLILFLSYKEECQLSVITRYFLGNVFQKPYLWRIVFGALTVKLLNNFYSLKVRN